jgi:GNAT superfamily N-acetyltransferase
LKPLDDLPVWSLVCFYVDKRHRGQRVTSRLIQGAIDYVGSQGGAIVEAYPTIPGGRRLQPVSSFMGVPAIFEAEGFVEVARLSKSRAVMRYQIAAV